MCAPLRYARYRGDASLDYEPAPTKRGTEVLQPFAPLRSPLGDDPYCMYDSGYIT
jgi:hypothetical protein